MRDFFEGLFTKNGKLHEKVKALKIQELDEDGAFQRTEETFLDAEEGTRTVETVVAHKAGCGHMLNSPKDLGGYCHFCGTSICNRCINIRCCRCMELTCTGCLRLYRGYPCCKKCRLIIFAKDASLSGMKALHTLMRKDIS